MNELRQKFYDFCTEKYGPYQVNVTQVMDKLFDFIEQEMQVDNPVINQAQMTGMRMKKQSEIDYPKALKTAREIIESQERRIKALKAENYLLSK